MNEISTFSTRFFTHVREKYQMFLFAISIIALTFTMFNALGNGTLLFKSSDAFFNSLFQLATTLSSIFTILFLPSYPIFFGLWKNTRFNIPEKLSIVIMLNLCFYILCGYIGFQAGFLITGLFFFGCVTLFYFSVITLVVVQELKNNDYVLYNPFRSKEKPRYSNLSVSLTTWLKDHKNTILLFVFLIGLCCFYVVRYSFFFGTDGWVHIYTARIITENGILPSNEWLGVLGIHIFSSVIKFFSGIDLIYLPRFFVFYTFLVSSLIFYNILMRIFKNRNLAVLGVFILQFFSLGFTHVMVQFWPTSLATMLSLEILFILYMRMEHFMKKNKPQRSALISNMSSSYSLIIILFICALLTHTFITFVILLSFLSVYLVYFLKDFNRGFDFALLCGLLGITLVFFSSSGTVTKFVAYIQLIEVPWYYYVAGGIAGGIGALIVLRQILKSISFTEGKFKAAITGKKDKYYKIIEDRYIYPLCLIIILFFIVIFLVGIISMLDVNPSKTLLGVESAVLVFFSFWGLLLFQKKPRGKFLMLWLLSFFLLYGVMLIVSTNESGRIAILAAPAIATGFVSYFYKLLKLNASNSLKISLFLIFLTMFSFSAFFYDDLIDPDLEEYDIKKREVALIQTFSLYNSEKSVIISEFGWGYIVTYYDYPYGQANASLSGSDIHYYIQTNQDFFHPSNHFNQSGANLLQELKREKGADVYLILDDIFLDVQNGGLDRLTKDEMNQYNNMDYMNKIMVSKSKLGEEVPLYWVI